MRSFAAWIKAYTAGPEPPGWRRRQCHQASLEGLWRGDEAQKVSQNVTLLEAIVTLSIRFNSTGAPAWNCTNSPP